MIGKKNFVHFYLMYLLKLFYLIIVLTVKLERSFTLLC
jgi:hypothetical protein